MIRSTSKRLAGRWFAALLALATAGVASSSSAQAAGCATGHARRSSPATYLGVLELLDVGRADADPLKPARDDQPRPCTGAFCSGMPATPLSTLPQAAPIGADDWAIAIPPVRLPESGAIVRIQDEPGLRAVDLADPIFHPPRPQAPTISL